MESSGGCCYNTAGSNKRISQEAGFVYGGNDGNSGELLEVDNDVLFREGLTLKGEVTYTPRLLSLDLQGSLGLLPQCGELYGRCSNSDLKPFTVSSDPVTRLNHIHTIQ